MALSLGATHVIDPSDESANRQLKTIAPKGFDGIPDTTANTDVVISLLNRLAVRGTMGLLGLPASADARLSIAFSRFLLKGQRIAGIIEGNADLRYLYRS